MKRISLIVFVMLFLLMDIPALAAPKGYNKYGDLADEYYYDDLGLLACVVQAEAGNQDLHGKELVADVVLNRMDNDMFPSTIKEIIFQQNQFSTVTDGALNKAYYTVTDECYQAVKNEIADRNDDSILFYSSLLAVIPTMAIMLTNMAIIIFRDKFTLLNEEEKGMRLNQAFCSFLLYF